MFLHHNKILEGIEIALIAVELFLVASIILILMPKGICLETNVEKFKCVYYKKFIDLSHVIKILL